MSKRNCSCDIKGLLERLEREICSLLRKKKKPDRCKSRQCDCDKRSSCDDECDEVVCTVKCRCRDDE